MRTIEKVSRSPLRRPSDAMRRCKSMGQLMTSPVRQQDPVEECHQASLLSPCSTFDVYSSSKKSIKKQYIFLSVHTMPNSMVSILSPTCQDAKTNSVVAAAAAADHSHDNNKAISRPSIAISALLKECANCPDQNTGRCAACHGSPLARVRTGTLPMLLTSRSSFIRYFVRSWIDT